MAATTRTEFIMDFPLYWSSDGEWLLNKNTDCAYSRKTINAFAPSADGVVVYFHSQCDISVKLPPKTPGNIGAFSVIEALLESRGKPRHDESNPRLLRVKYGG